MEEIYTSLSQSGLKLDEAARGGGAYCGASRNQQPTSELGSSEYIERLKRTRQVVAKTSFRQPKNAGGSAVKRNPKKASASSLETGISERSIHKAKDSVQVSKPPSRSKEDRNKKAGNGRSKIITRSSHTRSEALSTDTGDESSDELLLTSSSQPVETPRKQSIAVSSAATGPPESDSDDAGWRRSTHSETTSRRVSPSSSKKSQPRSHKSRTRSDENDFSDETPEKKKRKFKSRAAYGKQRDTSVEPLKGKHKSGWHASSTLNDRPMNLTEHSDGRSSKTSSLCDPIKLLLEEKEKEDKTPRPRKVAEGINVHVLAPFPMAREGMADRSLTSAEVTSKSHPAPFPLSKDTDLSNVTTQKNRRVIESPTEDLDSESSEDSDDPLLINFNDIVLRGGLAPFPMSLRDRPDNSRKHSGSQRVTSSRMHGSNVGIYRDPNETKQGPDEFLDVPEIVDFSFTQPGRQPDPETLCPYCDMPFPPNPSPLLLDMLERIPKYPDARPTNPLGLKAPLLSYVSMCQRHQFEMQLLPTAQAAGWPTCIDFAALPNRIRVQRQRLERVLYEKEKSIFWHELKQDINKHGVKKTMGIANQFDSFEKCQPGYYGEQGAVIIFQTLSHLFPSDIIDANYVTPLTLTEFLRYVLVPECAVALIQEDLGRGTTIEYAICTLRESSKYGTAMFPDLDNCDAMSLAGGDHGTQQVGDALIQERVRTRRLEIDEEERSEGASQEMGARNMKSSGGRQRARKVTKENDNGVEKAQERAGTSEVKARKKASTRGKKGRGDVIELSDSHSERTDTSAPDRPRKTRDGKASNLSDYSAKSRRPVNPSKESQPRAGAMTSKPRPKPPARPKLTSRAIVSEDKFPRSDIDEATPRPTARICRSPYESDSGIVLPEEDNLYKKLARSKTESSGSGAKLQGSSQPLKAAKERKNRKDAVFRKTMWENDDADESDNTSSNVANAGAKRTKPLIKTNSHSWLWSDSSTPSASPSG